MKKYLLLLVINILCVGMYAQSGDLNMKIVAHVPAGSGAAGSGIWHFVDSSGLEYAVIGLSTALVIYSLEDPSKPIERARVPGVRTIWREVYTYKNHIYAVTDESSDGVIIVNMRNAPLDITHKFWTSSVTANNQTKNITTCHTVFVDEKGILCLNGCSPWQGVLFFDINQDPDNPKFLGAETKRYCHDMYMRNDTMWSSDINNGLLSIWDVKDKVTPIELATITTPFAFTHNSWISDDAKYVFTTDERANAFVAAYDVSDLNNIRLVDQWRPKDTEGQGVIPHNTRFLDGYLITAYYTDGIKIIDAHRPENLIEVGSVDTYFGNQQGFHGCWGVSPFLPSKTIVASDIEGGLFVIKPDYIRACYLEGTVKDSLTNGNISQASVVIKSSRINGEETNLKGEYKTGYANAGTYEVVFSHPAYFPDTIQVQLQNGIVEIRNIKLLPRQSISQRFIIKEKGSMKLVENAQVLVTNLNRSVEGLTAADGATTLRVFQDPEVYDVIVGKWGYLHKAEKFNSENPSGDIIILVEKGYQDDFIFNLNWTVKSTARSGAWVRAEPTGTIYENNQFQTEFDIPSDLGNQCYVTGNSGIDPSEDDVDNGNTILTSPSMNLSSLNEPLLNYAYWFSNAGGNAMPNDKMKFKLTSGIDTFLIETISLSDSSWHLKENYKIKDLISNLNDVKFIVEIADEGQGHLVEGALDAFLVIDGNPVSTNDKTSELDVHVYPTIFNQHTTCYFNALNENQYKIVIYNSQGILAEEKVLNATENNLGGTLKAGFYIAQVIHKNQVLKSFRILKM
ncbi:MAG: choice-of-anchor B family protein [Saprospiraceae bacterium]